MHKLLRRDTLSCELDYKSQFQVEMTFGIL